MVGIKLKKSGQVFTFDFVIGFVMFIIIVVIAGKQLINIVPGDSYNRLYDENTYLSNTLIQPGYPLDWSPSDVLIPGIANNNRLDEDKLDDFDSFTFDETKSFFHIYYNYVFYFKYNNSILNIGGECMYGYDITKDPVTCEPDFGSLGHSNLVQNSRLLIYNSTVVEMVLVSWN